MSSLKRRRLIAGGNSPKAGSCAGWISSLGSIVDLPDDALFAILLFVGRDSIGSFAQVCKRFHESMFVPSAEGLWRDLVRIHHPTMARANKRLSSEEDCWWRNMFLGRERILRSFDKDELALDWQSPYTCSFSVPSRGATLPNGYGYIVRLLKKDGAMHTMPAFYTERDSISKGELDLCCKTHEEKLPAEDVERIDILVQRSDGDIAILYSGRQTSCKETPAQAGVGWFRDHKSIAEFSPYGGQDYENFSSTPKFDSSLCTHSDQRLLCAPYAEVSADFSHCRDASAQYSESYLRINLRMTWRDYSSTCVSNGARMSMTSSDVLLFLDKGVNYGIVMEEVSNQSVPGFTEARLRLPNQPAPLSAISCSGAELKRLGSYAIVVDYYDEANASLASKRTLFASSFHDNLRFGRQYKHLIENIIVPKSVREKMKAGVMVMFAISVVDKETGKQAKLFEGIGETDYKRGSDGCPYHAYEKFAALSFFAFRRRDDENDFLAHPGCQVTYFRRDEWDELAVYVCLWYKSCYCSAGFHGPGFVHADEEYYSIDQFGLIRFLSEGLVYY